MRLLLAYGPENSVDLRLQVTILCWQMLLLPFLSWLETKDLSPKARLWILHDNSALRFKALLSKYIYYAAYLRMDASGNVKDSDPSLSSEACKPRNPWALPPSCGQLKHAALILLDRAMCPLGVTRKQSFSGQRESWSLSLRWLRKPLPISFWVQAVLLPAREFQSHEGNCFVCSPVHRIIQCKAEKRQSDALIQRWKTMALL